MSSPDTSFKEDRNSILRALARLFIIIFVAAASLIAGLSWQNTLAEQRQALAHSSQLMAQGMRTHLKTFELVLNSMADELSYRGALTNAETGDELLARAKETDLGIVGYGLVGLDGEFLAASSRDLLTSLPNVVASDVSADSFRQVVENQRLYVGRPYYFSAIGEWIIPLRVPVYDQNNQLAAVLTAGNQIDGGYAAWARLPRPLNQHMLVIRNDGYLSYANPVPESVERLHRFFDQPISHQLSTLIASGNGFYRYLRLTQHGAEQVSYVWVERLPDHELSVVSVIPRSDVVWRWLESMLLPLGLWLVFAFLTVLGYRRARRLLRRADTELCDKQRALERSVQQYHELTRLLPIGVFQFRLTRDGTHEMTYTSQRFLDILELSQGAVPGVSLAEYVYRQLHPEDAVNFFRQQELATRQTLEFYWEGRLLQNDQERWISVHSVPSEEMTENSRLWNGVIVDITERKEAEHKINMLAYYDALTQLPNRRLLRQRLKKAVELAQAKKEYAAVLFIDIDRFKQLNDSFGHAQGDNMLQQIGNRLEDMVRDHDTVARLGGDEFVVLLNHLQCEEQRAASQVEVVIQKIQHLLATPLSIGEQTVRITLSTGITLIDGSEPDIDKVLQQADQAMYRAKEAGRNTQCFYDANIQQMITEQLEMQQDLREAINTSQLELFYQVQVNRNLKVAGVEALIRWHHPQRGVVSPGTFIPIAEQSDDIVRLGDWILRQACKQLVEWQEHAVRSHWTIAVNVSVRQLRADDFADKVLITLAETGARADHLVLEITESMLLVDTEQVIEKMARLKRVGVKFSLDDFGTGYSSLGYLNRLPIDELKIDQSFVEDMGNDEHHEVLIRTILSLGHTLSLTTIAEGVETEEQFRTLCELGCDQFQGYYFGRPVAVTELPNGIIET